LKRTFEKNAFWLKNALIKFSIFSTQYTQSLQKMLTAGEAPRRD
jgi:hypothetical protein